MVHVSVCLAPAMCSVALYSPLHRNTAGCSLEQLSSLNCKLMSVPPTQRGERQWRLRLSADASSVHAVVHGVVMAVVIRRFLPQQFVYSEALIPKAACTVYLKAPRRATQVSCLPKSPRYVSSAHTHQIWVDAAFKTALGSFKRPPSLSEEASSACARGHPALRTPLHTSCLTLSIGAPPNTECGRVETRTQLRCRCRSGGTNPTASAAGAAATLGTRR